MIKSLITVHSLFWLVRIGNKTFPITARLRVGLDTGLMSGLHLCAYSNTFLLYFYSNYLHRDFCSKQLLRSENNSGCAVVWKYSTAGWYHIHIMSHHHHVRIFMCDDMTPCEYSSSYWHCISAKVEQSPLPLWTDRNHRDITSVHCRSDTVTRRHFITTFNLLRWKTHQLGCSQRQRVHHFLLARK